MHQVRPPTYWQYIIDLHEPLPRPPTPHGQGTLLQSSSIKQESLNNTFSYSNSKVESISLIYTCNYAIRNLSLRKSHIAFENMCQNVARYCSMQFITVVDNITLHSNITAFMTNPRPIAQPRRWPCGERPRIYAFPCHWGNKSVFCEYYESIALPTLLKKITEENLSLPLGAGEGNRPSTQWR